MEGNIYSRRGWGTRGDGGMSEREDGEWGERESMSVSARERERERERVEGDVMRMKMRNP